MANLLSARRVPDSSKTAKYSYTEYEGCTRFNLIYFSYMNHTLESYRIFPYIAWVLVIGFAVFTYMLTTNLQAELGDVDNSIEAMEMRIDKLEAKQ